MHSSASPQPFGIPQTEAYAPYPLLRDPAEFGLVSTRVTSDEGSTVLRHRAARHGERATVFLHGAAGSWTTWTPLLQAARDAHLPVHEPVLIDVPGWGDGALGPAGLTLDSVVELITDSLLDLGYRQWDVVGHSLGGFLALHLAAAAPEHVRSVVTVSGTTWSVIESATHPLARFGALPGFVSLLQVMRLLTVLGRAGRAAVAGLHRAHVLRLMVAPLFRHPLRVPASVIDALSLELRPASFLAAAEIARDYPANRLWATIGCPVTALIGDRDIFVRDTDLQRLRTVIPQARTRVLADCGHFGPIEHPGHVLDALG